MTPNEKDYMDRYIYQVIRRLPKAQREEVRMELEELISDMYADRGSMEEVLTELAILLNLQSNIKTNRNI